MKEILLPFERTVADMRDKINVLSKDIRHDNSEKINDLEVKIEQELKRLYSDLSPSQKLLVSSHPDRINPMICIEKLFTDFTELRGDGISSDSVSVFGGIGNFKEIYVLILSTIQSKPMDAATYRKLIKLTELAEKFQRPVITFADFSNNEVLKDPATVKAKADFDRCVLSLKAPVISIITGTLMTIPLVVKADIRLMLENSVFSGDEVLTANELLTKNIIDGVIPEPIGGAHRHPELMVKFISDALEKTLKELSLVEPDMLLNRRIEKNTVKS